MNIPAFQIKPMKGRVSMKAAAELPESYKGNRIACIELEKSKYLARLLKTVQAITAILMIFAGCLLMPPSALTGMEEPFEHLSALMLGMLSVSILLELGRGIFMRLFSGIKPVLRFTGAYLHAGCQAYFDRKTEQIINLLPSLILTAALIILFLTAGDMTRKWIIWIIFTVEICFSIGLIYASVRFQQLPDDILVQNVGSTYLVYSSQKQPEP